jgi:uncharacterized protein YkwD
VQFLTNGGFESGQTPWSESSAAGYQLVSTSTPHSGTHAAWLCGYSSCNDSIGQTVTLPSSFTALSLTFWLDQTLPDSSCSGALKVVLKTAAGATIATPYSRCSSSATGGYAQQTASLTSALQPYAGQQVQVVFAGTATGSTNYYIDDAALTASGAPGSAPVATSTPTLVPTAVPTATSGSGSPCPGSTTGCAQYMLSILNKDRAANGVAPLTLNLTQTNGTASCVGSLGHSTAMQQSGSIWHTNASYPAASFPTDICVAYTRAGENVGEANYGNELTDLQQLDSMMMSEPHSPGCTGNHACNILYPSFHQVGIGVIYVNNATWLTEDFTN